MNTRSGLDELFTSYQGEKDFTSSECSHGAHAPLNKG